MGKIRVPALLLALLLALAACAALPEPDDSPAPDPQPEPQEPYALTLRLSQAIRTLDPPRLTARGGETVLFHLYENLMRWADDGHGWAVLDYGQAESYTVETDYAGNSTYTFTLREDIRWSDGTAVTAEDFVSAWRRIADPASNLPCRPLLEAVSGYGEVEETGDPTRLGVSAPDKRTFVVVLTGSPSYFLEEVCASAYTMPARAGAPADGSVTNGPYTARPLSGGGVTLEASETYYRPNLKGPRLLTFAAMEGPEADYAALQAGEADLAVDLPAEELAALAEAGNWTPEPVSTAYGVILNTRQAPFDNAGVRQAFRLTAASQAVVERLGNPALRATPGLVPYGIADYGQRPREDGEEDEEPVLPDPNAAPAPEEPEPGFWDFRAHSLELVTLEAPQDYESDCRYAQALMAQAGYAGGGGFPVVEYLYVESQEARAVALALQEIWKEQLGVTVTVRGVSQEEYDQRVTRPAGTEEEGAGGTGETGEGEEAEPAAIAAGDFTMAAQSFTAPYSDALALLERWHSESGDNASGYASDAFDILLSSARAAVSPDARDAYLHDAEAILLADAPVIPVLCQGGSFRLAEGLTGLYRGPDGVYFLQDTVRTESGAAS